MTEMKWYGHAVMKYRDKKWLTTGPGNPSPLGPNGPGGPGLPRSP